MAIDLTVLDERNPFPEGMGVAPEDLTQLQANIDNAVGRLLVGLVGSPNALPSPGMATPLSISATGGMNISIGGSGIAFVQGRPVDAPPLENFTLGASTSQQRTDLIAIAFNRTAGSASVSRRVRADNAPSGQLPTQATLVAGTIIVTYPTQAYTAPPFVFLQQLAPNASNPDAQITLTITPTQVTITSSDPTDTRSFNVYVIGASSTANGVATNIDTTEAQCKYVYVQGTPGAGAPAAPAGYEAFATIVVHANETSISPSDITYLFATLAPPIQNFLAQYITAVTGIYCYGPINAAGAVTSNGIIFGSDSMPDAGKMALSGLVQYPLIQCIGGDNQTGAFWDGPTALAPTNPPSYFFQVGVYTPAFAGLYLGYQGNAGFISPAGYAIGGSTYGPTATIDGELTVDGNALINGTQIINGPLQVDGASSVYSVTATGPVTFDQTLRVNGLTTLEQKLQVNSDIGSTGNLYINNGTFGGNVGVGGNVLVNGNATVAGTLAASNNATVGGGLAVSGPISGDITHTTGVPVGGVIPVNGQVTDGNGVTTLTLPTLPPGEYELYFDAAIDTNTNGSINIHGGGSAGSGSLNWPANIVQADQLFAQQPYKMFGTASGGATPAVSVTMAGGTTGFLGQMRLTATRLS